MDFVAKNPDSFAEPSVNVCFWYITLRVFLGTFSWLQKSYLLKGISKRKQNSAKYVVARVRCYFHTLTKPLKKTCKRVNSSKNETLQQATSLITN